MSTHSERVRLAIEEAYASAPQDIIILETLEVNHESFDEPIRIVRWPVTADNLTKFTLRLEETAPVNAGELVEFIGAPFELVRPEKDSNNPGTFTIRIDGIDDHLDEYMKNAAIDGGIITATFREYVQGRETEGPGTVWYGIELISPRLEGLTFVIEGAILHWMFRPFGELYRAINYPALVAGR